MDLDAASVDEQFVRNTIDPGKLSEDALLHAALGPPSDAVVERLLRTIKMLRTITLLFNAWTVLESTRRSSTRGIPGVSGGKSGSTRTQWSSEKTNPLFHLPPRWTQVNYLATPL